MFGPMSGHDVSRSRAERLDHHLRQFGVRARRIRGGAIAVQRAYAETRACERFLAACVGRW